MLILLPEQSLDASAVAAERLRAAVEALAIPHAGGGPGNVVTISAGVAHLEQSDGADPEVLIKRADVALYRAKNLGRNRVEIGRPGPPPPGPARF